ncbi:MAG TPA: hypothetical protein VGF17_20835 [Phytomonospora sp.]
MPGQHVRYRIEGLTAVTRGLLELGLEVEDLKNAFSAIADEGARQAALFAPKLTGRLAGDIRGNRARSKAVVTAGRVSVPYAGAINYGWARHNIEPSGFLQKVDYGWEDYGLRRLEEEINAQIARRGLR